MFPRPSTACITVKNLYLKNKKVHATTTMGGYELQEGKQLEIRKSKVVYNQSDEWTSIIPFT